MIRCSPSRHQRYLTDGGDPGRPNRREVDEDPLISTFVVLRRDVPLLGHGYDSGSASDGTTFHLCEGETPERDGRRHIGNGRVRGFDG